MTKELSDVNCQCEVSVFCLLELKLCKTESLGVPLIGDSNMAADDAFDERSCHCDMSAEDLLPSIKCVIRAVR